MAYDNSLVADSNGSRPYGQVLAEPIGVLTDAARHTGSEGPMGQAPPMLTHRCCPANPECNIISVIE